MYEELPELILNFNQEKQPDDLKILFAYEDFKERELESL